LLELSWCRRRNSNPYALRREILSRLPADIPQISADGKLRRYNGLAGPPSVHDLGRSGECWPALVQNWYTTASLRRSASSREPGDGRLLEQVEQTQSEPLRLTRSIAKSEWPPREEITDVAGGISSWMPRAGDAQDGGQRPAIAPRSCPAAARARLARHRRARRSTDRAARPRTNLDRQELRGAASAGALRPVRQPAWFGATEAGDRWLPCSL
jgi:hypothetical protein